MLHYRPMRALASLLLVAALAACSPPDSAYHNRGGPETLLDVSSEIVNLRVDNPAKVAELASWIEKDFPTRAELYCTAGDPRCDEARRVLELNAIPTMLVPSRDYSVALVYERILARDCKQQFVDNTGNPYNAPHPAFGCAVAANIVQQVSDKQQFVEPNIMDLPDAKGSADAYRRAYTQKTEPVKAYSVGDSLAAKAKSN